MFPVIQSAKIFSEQQSAEDQHTTAIKESIIS